MGTALVYDEEMTKYKLLWVDPACKIEVPERLVVSYEALVKSGLAGRCTSIAVREAADAEILLAHRLQLLLKHNRNNLKPRCHHVHCVRLTARSIWRPLKRPPS